MGRRLLWCCTGPSHHHTARMAPGRRVVQLRFCEQQLGPGWPHQWEGFHQQPPQDSCSWRALLAVLPLGPPALNGSPFIYCLMNCSTVNGALKRCLSYDDMGQQQFQQLQVPAATPDIAQVRKSPPLHSPPEKKQSSSPGPCSELTAVPFCGVLVVQRQAERSGPINGCAAMQHTHKQTKCVQTSLKGGCLARKSGGLEC